VLVKGETTTAADVHDAWAAWKAEREPQNRHIRPFSELDDAVREQDEPFAAAIREVANGISADGPRGDYLKG
jgi:hypothetical protein